MSEIVKPGSVAGGEAGGLINLAQERAQRADWDSLIKIGVPPDGYLGELLHFVSEHTGQPLEILLADIVIRGSKSFAASLEESKSSQEI